MSIVSEKVIDKALKEYGITEKEICMITERSDRLVWRVTTQKGDYALKFVAKKSASTIAEVSKYLAKMGVPVIIVLPTIYGDSFVRLKDGCLLLFPWVKGAVPRYEEPNMTERIVTLLAIFHERSRGFVSQANSVKSNLDWPSYYSKRIKFLNEISLMARSDSNPFFQLFFDHYSWLQKRCTWVIERLPHTGFTNLAKLARLDPLLGHGDYSQANLLLDNNGELTIIDLDNVSISLPIWDLSRLITWMNHALQDWSLERFEMVLNTYQQVRELTENEKELLLIDQVFPHQVIDLARKYNRKTAGPTTFEELKRSIEIDKKKIRDLRL
ncbi:phosphotransferase [Brevibacillus sp. 179-C9.3 HS]|uniref:phosphotransferase n=1 Tax=unclassified Brevibacillus TaxID=2684853 RepID=UPI0039A3ECA2